MTSLKEAIQILLFQEPLYRYMSADGVMRAVAFGWNEAAEAFTDTALAVGQLPGHGLQITVCTPSPEDHLMDYLSKRPALAEYIDVQSEENVLTDATRHYGTLRFCETEAYLSRLQAMGAEAADLPRYVFVAAEDQRLSALRTDQPPLLVARAEAGGIFIQRGADLRPLEGELQAGGALLSLRDMAFNAHLVWFLQANNDIQAEWKRFTSPLNDYNLLSSQSYALSIPYKLWSAGIDFDDPQRAAEEFAQKLAEDQDHALLYQLMDLEQRRWVMEKVTAGYETSYRRGEPAPFEAFVKNASVKSPRAHICIQHSEPSAPLESEWYQKKNHQNWDTPNPEDDKLDDLDRMSIDLHRFMRQKADALRDSRFADRSPHVKALGELLRGVEAQARRAAGPVQVQRVNPLRTEYNRYLFCLRAILDGSTPYAKQYDAYEADFLHAFERHAAAYLRQVQIYLQQIRHDLFPAIEANLYRNYKQNNRDLVRYIPFVLTYKRLQHLAVPFSAAAQRTNINDLIFSNVASPMVIKPGLLLYLYYAEAAVNPDTFDGMLRSCLAFLSKNRIPCAVQLAVCFDPAISAGKSAKWRSNLNKLTEEGLIEKLILHQEGAPEAFFARQMAEAGVTLYDGTTALFPSGYRQAKWLEQLRASTGYFEMNPATKQFFTEASCRWLTHIYDTSFLRIDDMFALLNCTGKEYDYPDCTEYVFLDEHSAEPEPLFQCLWKIYTGEATRQTRENAIHSWNELCDVLDPSNTCKVAGAGRLDMGSGQVKFWKLLNPDPKTTGRSFRRFGEKSVGSAIRILERIGGMYSCTGEKLLNITYDRGGRIDTIEPTRDSIAKILSKAGTMLEVYSYYRALETGFFDDIACSCTFYWGDQELAESERKNEIDLILTKGFQSILAECKGTADLTQEYFHKLNSITDLFGVNAHKVLIANTYSSSQERIRRNQEQISRGELMDILTIHQKEDIARIGTRLASLMQQRAR